jgi:predicted ATPase
LFTALRRDGRVTEIALSALDAVETASLAKQVAGHDLDSNLVAALYQETEGNPLFVVETVRAGTLEGATHSPGERNMSTQALVFPPSAQAVIAARLEQLSPTAREVANLAAVIGREFTFSQLLQISNGDEDQLVHGLDELWQRRLVREQGEEMYDFSHDKLRQGIYAALSTARRP